MSKTEKMIVLMELLKIAKDKNRKAMILQSYIQTEGAIPKEYEDKIRDLLVEE